MRCIEEEGVSERVEKCAREHGGVCAHNAPRVSVGTNIFFGANRDSTFIRTG